MKRIWKTLAALLSAALLINSMFAVSTMKVYAEPAEENLSSNELSTGTSERTTHGISSGEGSTSGTTSNEGTSEGEGTPIGDPSLVGSEGEGNTTDLPDTEDPDDEELSDEEIALLLAGDNAVSVFATRSTTPLGKFSMTFAEGSLEHASVIYTADTVGENESWSDKTWTNYTGGEVSATRVLIQPNEGYELDVENATVNAVAGENAEIPENPGTPTNNIMDYNLCGDVASWDGLWLLGGWTYTFSGLKIVEIVEMPAKLNVSSYDSSYGTIKYLGSDGAEYTVPADGISDVTANRVWWIPTEPKYSLNTDKLVVSVMFEGEEDVAAKDTFCNIFTNDSKNGYVADLWPNMTYSLSGVEFVEGRATFRWSYQENITGHEDEYVGHGRIQITSATYGGTEVTNSGDHNDTVYWINDTDFSEDGNTWKGGEGAFLPGTVVTITLIPDRGYQLTEFTINKQPNSTTALGEISTFTFKVPSKDFHLGAKFTKMDDEVDSKASGISGGTLDIADNEYEKGTAALTVNNTSVSDEEESAFVANAQQAGFEVAKYVDLKLENRFYKGNTTDFWTTAENKTDLTSPATISLSLSDITADDFEIVHQKHNGSYEVLDATYSNGSVTFMTKSFSKFAIVAKGMKTSSTPESGSTTPSSSSSSSDDSDDEDTASTVTTENNTSLGTVVGGSVVKDWDGLEKILENKTSTGNKTTDGNTTAAPIVLTLNQRNSTVPVSTLRALEASESVGLHLMMGNGAAITIANGAGLKNQPAINLSNKVETTRNSKTISFASNTKLNALVALHMSVPKNVKEIKLYYYINGHAYFLGTLTPLNGQVMFPISQLGIYKLVY